MHHVSVSSHGWFHFIAKEACVECLRRTSAELRAFSLKVFSDAVSQVDVDRQLKIQGRNERKFDLGTPGLLAV